MADKRETKPNFPFELKCPNCGSIHVFSDFTASIIQQGLILLDNPDFCRFGCTCLFCDETTIIKKFDKNSSPEEVINLFNCICSNREWYYSIFNTSTELYSGMSEIHGYGLWEYNSFPYRFFHPTQPFFGFDKELPENSISFVDFDSPHSICDDPENQILESEKEKIHGSSVSYLCGSRVAQPAASVLWFAENEIDELLSFENKQKKKVFPRYTLYDSTWESMQLFCWDHRIQLDFANKMSGLSGIPLVEHLSMPSKKMLAQAYELLTILDQPHPDTASSQNPKVPSASINIAPQSIVPMKPLKKNSIYRNKEARERITRKIWDHFNKDFIQEMLITRSDKFILDFLELSNSISFSRNSVWDLKEKFLLELHGAITSKYRRRIEQKNDVNYWQKKAEEAEKNFPDVQIVSQSPEINKLKVRISKLPKVISVTDFNGPILLLGERGTGKTHFAKAIHSASQRNGAFVKIDCGAKSENLFESELFGHVKGAFTGATEYRKGAFEMAAGGTLFLDEIGNIPSTLQRKLLGVIQEREYQPVGSSKTKTTDAFIIAATNADLEQMVENDEFRDDLFDRLNQEAITIPPLRDRKMDIPLFFKNLKTNIPVDPDLGTELKRLKYDWPGNVRELINTVERIERHKVLEDDTSPICFDDLLKQIKFSGNKEKKSIAKDEKKSIGPGNTKVTDDEVKQAMANNNNNKTWAAKELGVHVQTIRRRCDKLGI